MRRLLSRPTGPILAQFLRLHGSLRFCQTSTTANKDSPSLTESGDAALAAVSPFLADLLDPPVTTELVDATRTYASMDVVDRCAVYDPSEPIIAPSSSEGETGEGPVAAAHRKGRLWSAFAGAAEGGPPAWFEQLCRDLYFRRGGEDDGLDAAAAGSEGVDPYLWLPFDLLDEREYRVGPYVFPASATYTTEQRLRLCLGRPAREYVHFCNTYAFPQRMQLPTSVGTEPARLYVDPLSPTPLVYVQLSPDYPPCMWLPVRPSAAALRRVLGEYAQMAALHRDWHHAHFTQRMEDARRVIALQRLPFTSEGDVLRFMAYEGRNTAYGDVPIREFANEQEFFLGEHDDPERLLEHLDLCPFLFAMPHLRTVVDPHAEHMLPTVDGPGVAPSVYRCIFSKALVLITVQLSAEVKLPPQDPEAFTFMWKDSQVVPKMKIPVFARVIWPDAERMGAGGALVRRFNKLFNTEFAPDMPPDAVLTLFYVMQWAGMLPELLGVRGMRQRVAELEAACHRPEPQRLYPGTREIPNPEYTTQERLGMHLQYLSMLGDPDISTTLRNLLPTASAPVRMGCAKAALIAGDRALFRQIVSSEPPGRMQLYMTKIVRKRKTRDLVDPEPRLLEEQYEFAAPLWTRRGRVDRSAALEANRSD